MHNRDNADIFNSDNDFINSANLFVFYVTISTLVKDVFWVRVAYIRLVLLS